MSIPSGAVWGRAEQQDFRGRVRGCLLGGAVGDALGTGVADLSLDEIRALETAGREPDGRPASVPVVDYVPAYGRRGAVSSATQLTLFTVDGLIRAQVRRDTGAWHPPTDVYRAHRRWAATQHAWGPDERRKDNGWLGLQDWLYARRAPALACLTGLGDERMGTLDRPKNPGARDAGALVRSAPFGLLVGWEPQLVCQLAVECATQTHGHPGAYLSAGAFAVIVHGIARGEFVESAVHRALALIGVRAGHESVSEALHLALAGAHQGTPVLPEAPGSGRGAEEVLAVAVYCALVGEDIRHGLRLAVSHSGPSDATGSLCGALLGTLHGETALPPAWIAELEGRGTLLELADDFAMELTQGPALHRPAAGDTAWLTRYPRAVDDR